MSEEETFESTGNLWGDAAQAVDIATQPVRDGITAAGEAVTGAVNAAGDAVTGAANAVGDAVNNATNAIGEAWTAEHHVGTTVWDIGGAVVDGDYDKIQDAVSDNGVVQAASDVVESFTSGDVLGGIANAAKVPGAIAGQSVLSIIDNPLMDAVDENGDMSASDASHGILSTVGVVGDFVPGIGWVVAAAGDGADAAIYAAEGDTESAKISAVSAIPVVGTVGGIGMGVASGLSDGAETSTETDAEVLSETGESAVSQIDTGAVTPISGIAVQTASQAVQTTMNDVQSTTGQSSDFMSTIKSFINTVSVKLQQFFQQTSEQLQSQSSSAYVERETVEDMDYTTQGNDYQVAY